MRIQIRSARDTLFSPPPGSGEPESCRLLLSLVVLLAVYEGGRDGESADGTKRHEKSEEEVDG